MTAFLIFLFGYILSQFFRSFLAVVAPELSAELGLTAQDLGIVSASWFAAFALAQFPVGWALDIHGPRRSVPLMMLAAVAGAGLLAAAQNVWHCILAMGLIGIGCAPIYMGALYVFARTLPAAKFATYSSVLIGIGSLGNLAAASPLAWLVEDIGWRVSFALIAGLTAIAALMIRIMITDPPRIETAPDEARSFLGDVVAIVSMRALWPIFPIALVSYAVVAAERGLWVGPFLADVYGLGPIERGQPVFMMALAMSIGALAYGPMDRIVGSRKWVVVAGSLVTATLFMGLGWIGHDGLWTATALLAGIGGVGLTYAVLMAHGRAFLPEHMIGRGITFLNFLLIGGAGLVQSLSGSLVAPQRAAGVSDAQIYSNLHFGFGVALVVVTVIYLLSRDMPPRTN